ncbi:MAG TPA: amidohydrolase, partial [Vicinamibacterales bacterium]|nr:amidohydrolase [Vicinamibacterales bacterium]
MRIALVMFFAIALGASAPVARQASKVTDQVRARVDALAAELHPSIVAIRRDIHRNPELGFREKRTAGLVAGKLRALKFDEVRTGVGVTGVIGVLKGSRPGPVVAWRADMDALPVQELNENMPFKSIVPNVKHACGHDGHTAIALGVAEIFSRMRAEIPGTVVFLFQPAEEGDPDGGKTGALRVIEDWPLTNPTPVGIFGLHTQPALRVGQVGYQSGAAMASSDRFIAKIIGQQTHGAAPHTGIDPVPVAAAAIMAFQMIPSRMIDARLPTVVSVGMINAGTRFNIIADSVTLTGTVRTLDREGPSTVKSKMNTILKGLSAAHGADYSLEYIETTPVTYNDPALVAASLPALRDVVGDKLVPIEPVMIAEDFAFYQQKIPGFYFFLGVGNPERNITAMLHTEYYDL